MLLRLIRFARTTTVLRTWLQKAVSPTAKHMGNAKYTGVLAGWQSPGGARAAITSAVPFGRGRVIAFRVALVYSGFGGMAQALWAGLRAPPTPSSPLCEQRCEPRQRRQVQESSAHGMDTPTFAAKDLVKRPDRHID